MGLGIGIGIGIGNNISENKEDNRKYLIKTNINDFIWELLLYNHEEEQSFKNKPSVKDNYKSNWNIKDKKEIKNTEEEINKNEIKKEDNKNIEEKEKNKKNEKGIKILKK